MEITIIGAPMDLGADRRGVDMGPSAIRYADLDEKLRKQGHTVRDLGNIQVTGREMRTAGNPRLKYLDAIVASARELAARTDTAVRSGAVPLLLGGDHSIALGSVGGVADAVDGDVGVIWLDAHADFNSAETTPSGNIHGMVLGALAGYGEDALVHATGPGPRLNPARIAIVGARDLDPGECELLRRAGVLVLTMADVDRRGMHDVTEEALARASEGTRGLHVSFDMDVMDPSEAPGVGTPVPGGITYREAHLAMELVAASGKLTSMDLVEVNPILDQANRTAQLATELALSATGKRII